MEIEIGKKYKAAKLCEAYGKSQLRGGYLTNFLKQVEKDYEIKKAGAAYEIIRKRSEEEKMQLEVKGLYQKAVEMILCKVLGGKEEYSATYSIMELMVELGMVNMDYKYCRYNTEEAAMVIGADDKELNVYMNLSYPLLSDLLKRVLKDLENKMVIIVHKGYRTYDINEDGYWVNLEDVKANSKEESTLLRIGEQALCELGLSSKNMLYSKNGYYLEKYQSICAKKCKEEYGKSGFYSVYNITLNKSGLKRNAEKIKVELNKKMQDKLLDAKSMVKSELTDLEKFIEATIDLDRKYEIREKVLLAKENGEFGNSKIII